MRRIKKFDSEENLQIQVADYLRLQYPNVLFHSDYGSGVNLTIGQAVMQKRLNGGKRAWPDMFIAEPKVQKTKYVDYLNGKACSMSDFVYHGLFLELKKDGTKLKREKDCKKPLKIKVGRNTVYEDKIRRAGDWWDLHIEEQAEMLKELRHRGYKAEFAVGFEQAKQIIDDYLGAKS